MPGSWTVPKRELTGYYEWSSSIQDESVYAVEIDNGLSWLLVQGGETETLIKDWEDGSVDNVLTG